MQNFITIDFIINKFISVSAREKDREGGKEGGGEVSNTILLGSNV